MIKIIFILLLIPLTSFAEIYQWEDSNGTINYSDKKPDKIKVTVIKLKESILIEPPTSLKTTGTRIISWEITDHQDSYINVAVKYFYDGKFKEQQTWLSAHTLDNGSRSMNYSVRPSKIKKGSGIINIRLGVSTRAPKRHCTNQIKFSMYGKNIPTFHESTVNFSKCWTNNYIAPTTSTPTKGIN